MVDLLIKAEVGPESAPDTDNIRGDPGNNILTHGNAWYDYSDGKIDFLDCGLVTIP